jgi:hypothetical protein
VAPKHFVTHVTLVKALFALHAGASPCGPSSSGTYTTLMVPHFMDKVGGCEGGLLSFSSPAHHSVVWLSDGLHYAAVWALVCGFRQVAWVGDSLDLLTLDWLAWALHCMVGKDRYMQNKPLLPGKTAGALKCCYVVACPTANT